MRVHLPSSVALHLSHPGLVLRWAKNSKGALQNAHRVVRMSMRIVGAQNQGAVRALHTCRSCKWLLTGNAVYEWVGVIHGVLEAVYF